MGGRLQACAAPCVVPLAGRGSSTGCVCETRATQLRCRLLTVSVLAKIQWQAVVWDRVEYSLQNQPTSVALSGGSSHVLYRCSRPTGRSSHIHCLTVAFYFVK